MKIYFTDTSGMRVLEECNLTEIQLKDKFATNGITVRPMYRIFNVPFGGHDKTAVTFGGDADIGEALRNGFWQSVSAMFKYNIPIFDVDEWHGNIKFVTPEDLAVSEKTRKKKRNKSAK